MTSVVHDFESLPNTARLTLRSVLIVAGTSRASIYRWIANGRFPPPIKAPGLQNSWRVGTIRAWLAGTWKKGDE